MQYHMTQHFFAILTLVWQQKWQVNLGPTILIHEAQIAHVSGHYADRQTEPP